MLGAVGLLRALVGSGGCLPPLFVHRYHERYRYPRFLRDIHSHCFRCGSPCFLRLSAQRRSVPGGHISGLGLLRAGAYIPAYSWRICIIECLLSGFRILKRPSIADAVPPARNLEDRGGASNGNGMPAFSVTYYPIA